MRAMRRKIDGFERNFSACVKKAFVDEFLVDEL